MVIKITSAINQVFLTLGDYPTKIKDDIIQSSVLSIFKEATSSHCFSTTISNYSIILVHNKAFFRSKLDLKDAKIFLMGGISFSLSPSGT